jgi:heme exporter protein A
MSQLYRSGMRGTSVTAEQAADVQLKLTDVGRRFGRRVVFQNLSAEARSGQTLVLAGANGSGKSTLMKIVAGLLPPSAGQIDMRLDSLPLDPVARRAHIGFVAPDLTLYGELSGAENILFFARLRGIDLTREDLISLLERVGLKGRGRDYVGNYSSGMRQRLKYAFALLHRPPILLLDEPTANLDVSGMEIVERVVLEQKTRGLVVVATNEPREVAWADVTLRIDGETTA